MNDYLKEVTLSEYRELLSDVENCSLQAEENRRYARGRPDQAATFLKAADDWDRMWREKWSRKVQIEEEYPYETDCIQRGVSYKPHEVRTVRTILSPEEEARREAEAKNKAAQKEAEERKARREAEKRRKRQAIVKGILIGIAAVVVIALIAAIVAFPDKAFFVLITIAAISLVGAIASAYLPFPQLTMFLWIVFGVSIGILLIFTLVRNVGKSYTVDDIAEMADKHSDSHDLYPHEAEYVGSVDLKDNEVMLIYTMTGKTKGGNGWEETIYIAEFVKQKKNGEYKKPSKHRIGREDYPGVYSFEADYDGFDDDKTILLVVNTDCKTIKETSPWPEGSLFRADIDEYPKILDCGKVLESRFYDCLDKDGNKIVKSMY